MLGESIECLSVSLFIGHIMTEHVYMNTHSWIHYREDSFNQAYICRVKGHTHLGIRVNGIFNQTLTHIEEMKIGRGQACENTSSSPCFTQHNVMANRQHMVQRLIIKKKITASF